MRNGTRLRRLVVLLVVFGDETGVSPGNHLQTEASQQKRNYGYYNCERHKPSNSSLEG